jgi:ribonuclease BN (tRNA processing enzyme)
MRLRVLGSSGGWPAAGKPCSGYLLEAGEHRVWVDAGPGTLAELLRHCAVASLDAVWISHLHPDHCSDLLAAYHSLTYGTPRTSPLPVFGPPGWAARMDAFVDRPGAMATVFQVHELHDGFSWHHWPLTLDAVAVHHTVPTFGLRATRKGVTLAYTSDTTPGPGVDELAAGAHLLLAEAYGEGHDVSSAEQVARCAAEHQVGRLVLTHLHPDADPLDAARSAAAVYGGQVDVAQPGDVFDCP